MNLKVDSLQDLREVVGIDGYSYIIPLKAYNWLKHKGTPTNVYLKHNDVKMGKSIFNGTSYTKTGVRNIVLNENYELTEIIGRQTKGYQPDRCTYQLMQNDDIMLTHKWGHGEDVIIGRRYDDSELSYEEVEELLEYLKENISSAYLFITKSCGRGPSYIDDPGISA